MQTLKTKATLMLWLQARQSSLSRLQLVAHYREHDAKQILTGKVLCLRERKQLFLTNVEPATSRHRADTFMWGAIRQHSTFQLCHSPNVYSALGALGSCFNPPGVICWSKCHQNKHFMERLPAHRGNTSPDWCLMLMRHIRKKSLITAFSPGSLSCCLEMSSSGQSSLVSQSPSLGRKKGL